MKKLMYVIPIFILLFAAGFLPVDSRAFALSTPHIVIGDGVWLYDSQTNNKLFMLPKSYYAKIDNLDNDYYYITFNGVSGKVEKELVSTVGYHTQAAGTMQELTIDPQFSDFNTITVKAAMDSSLNEFAVSTSEKFIFLGEYPLTEMWYCVKVADKVGYIKAARTTLPEINIPVFTPEIEPTDTAPVITYPEETENGNKTTIRIIIIAAVCLVALLLVFLLFRPTGKTTKPKKYYYDDE